MGRSLSQHYTSSTLHTTIQNREPRHVPHIPHPNLPSYGRFLQINMSLHTHRLHTAGVDNISCPISPSTQSYHLICLLSVCACSILFRPTSSSCKLEFESLQKYLYFRLPGPSAQQQPPIQNIIDELSLLYCGPALRPAN